MSTHSGFYCVLGTGREVKRPNVLVAGVREKREAWRTSGVRPLKAGIMGFRVLGFGLRGYGVQGFRAPRSRQTLYPRDSRAKA